MTYSFRSLFAQLKKKMCKLNFPEHICIVGKTGSGKSRLLGEILCRNDELYDRGSSENIAVVVSPHKTCKIRRYVGDRADWDIHRFCMSRFDEQGVRPVLEYLEEIGDLGKIMLLLDNIAFRAQFGTKAAEVLVELC